MLFNSYIFIIIFLPLCILGYYTLNHFRLYRAGQLFLTAMSLWYYAYYNPKYLGLILSSVAVNYLIYLIMERIGESVFARRAVLCAGLCFDLGVLVYYKYANFFIITVNQVGGLRIPLLEVEMVLPLGISFFTFQQISFLVDTYRREVPRYPFVYYISYVTFFPQLIAGPIVTHDELIPQFLNESKKRIDWDMFAKGINIFVIGLSKKVLLADVLGGAVFYGYEAIDTLNSTSAVLVMLCYTFQIYFDFSGYCDMAIGVGKMLNIDLPLNFNSPYKALTITEFWDRWHMTLTRFFTKYVYIPLGGSRRGRVRTYVNILIVFFLSGFWHGAGWTFLVWGICHGVFSVVTRHWKRFFEAMHPALSWLITFGFINVMWVFFRADSLGDAMSLLRQISMCEFEPIDSAISNCFRLNELLLFVSRTTIEERSSAIMIGFLVIAMVIVLGAKNSYERMQEFQPRVRTLLTLAVLLVWCIFSFGEVSTFLYFNF